MLESVAKGMEWDKGVVPLFSLFKVDRLLRQWIVLL